jgi:hypothetical protein
VTDASHPTSLRLAAWLQAAYEDPAAGCPPPEAFLAAERAALDPADRRRLEAHAERCPACAAERGLARLFDAAPEQAGARPADVEALVARLAAASPLGGAEPVAPASGAQVIRFPGRSEKQTPVEPGEARTRGASRRIPARPWSLTRLAAAAILVLAAGLGFQLMRSAPPELPDPGRGEAVRGATIEVLEPLGDLSDAPAELRWAPWNGAAAYRVRIVEVDGTVLWELRLPAASPARPGTPFETALLPGEVRARLQRAVTYRWTVEALGPAASPDPARLAVSEPAEFRIHP